jgi:alanine racemase
VEAVTATRPTRAEIDLDALAGNLRAISAHVAEGAAALGRRAPGVIAVVKANAYGHGAVRAALTLEAAGAQMLACADLQEGIELREAGVRLPILVFGALSVSDPSSVFTHALMPVVSSPTAAEALERAAAARGVRLTCHLEIDTGMNRLGFRHDNLHRTLPPIARSPHLRVDTVYTHFATADVPGDPLFDVQRERFEGVRELLPRLGIQPAAWHAANSAALLRDARVSYDFVRPGLALYGVVPPPLETSVALRPVMTLRSRVVTVKGIRPGEGVSYGMHFRTDRARSVAVIPAGYADGIDTRLGGRGEVLIRGRRVPIVGAVCMDMMMADVTGLDATPGDEVVIVGAQGDERIHVRDVAAVSGAIPWDLLCRVGTRVARVYA